MYHFNGTWLDLFFTCFFILGLVWTGLLLLIIIWSLLSSLKTKRDSKEARDKVIAMLNPEARRKKLEEILEDTNQKIQEIKDEQNKNKEVKGGNQEKN